ncbi:MULTISPECIES: phytanoyl-CoA dioxygenase family protein [unclassified Brevundimonas]|uniref:phytanoyl-CoA dioxygenase family protein n=1 Tax=unclassified Brevundimonas TaxID=2622653 RepID=UPI0025C24DFB|nr:MULTISPECIES: phytanoyl-CoA dioxygenase family protein [unclassified Brevundimonas]
MLDFHRFLPLSSSLKRTWRNDGYALLKSAVSPIQIDSVEAVIDEQWECRAGNVHQVDVLTGSHAGRTFLMQEAPAEVRDEAYKLNNLFLHNSAIRDVAYAPRIRKAVADFLGGEPIICNSLNFARGSQQDAHIDSWYMPAPNAGPMVAVSIALEPVHTDNGPIFFIPGSQRIPPYKFSDGRLNIIPDEAEHCGDYLENEIRKRALQRKNLTCNSGDAFIWHGQLIHGGSAIQDFSLTRKSLVVHYWRVADVEPAHVIRDSRGAYLRRTLRGELNL